jgi:hypothetical protein
MAVYNLSLEKDTSLYSENPSANTGRDQILEIGSYKDASNTSQLIRTLVKVSQQDIQNVVDNLIGHTDFSCSLNLYLAEASEIPVDLSIECFPVSLPWDNGTGMYGDEPTNTTGTTWTYRSIGNTNPWVDSLSIQNVTGSSNIFAGGGTWYLTGSTSQSFFSNNELDLTLDITEGVKLFYNNILQNNGFLIKLSSEIEDNPSGNIRLRYFSKDTHTIYPSTIQFKWNDSTYITGSLQTINDTNLNINVKNNKEVFRQSEVVNFRLHTRPRYPVRTFTTSSIYLSNYALPENSLWSIVDYYTNDTVIDFDNVGTKISCDENGSYFKVFMNSLQPERYYKVLIKTSINGSTVILDNNLIFKVQADE